MNILVLKKNLKDGLITIEKAVSESTTLPILKNILLETYDNRIKLSSTNLELAITNFISGKIIENGGLTIPFSTFYNIVNNTTSEKIALEKINNNLLFKTDNYEAKIQGLSKEEFPIIPKIENTENYLEFDAKIFKNSILKVVNAAQISEIRPEISGILFDFQISSMKLAATDSFRLAEKTLLTEQFKTNMNQGFKVIVPLKTVQEVIRIFPDDKHLRINIDSNQILFKNENLELISRLIDGSYPDYEQIIPKTIETEIQLNRDYFVNALKLVSSFSGKSNDVKLKIKDGKKVLEIYSVNQYLGENNYIIPVKANGPGFEELAFNWRYLLDGLKTIDSENVIFGVNGDSKPAVIKSPDDISSFYILMPIKTS